MTAEDCHMTTEFDFCLAKKFNNKVFERNSNTLTHSRNCAQIVQYLDWILAELTDLTLLIYLSTHNEMLLLHINNANKPMSIHRTLERLCFPTNYQILANVNVSSVFIRNS